MGCRHACVCGGICITCERREPEEYFGHADDILSQQMGYKNYDDHREHYKKMYEEAEIERLK